MKVFNNENQSGEVILLLPKKEIRQLIEMCEEACNNNKRKSGWKRLKDQLTNQACCY